MERPKIQDESGRFQTDPALDGARKLGFELFCSSDQGKRMPLRAIAQRCGVTLRAVQYWREKDGWDEKLNKYNDVVAKGITLQGGALKLILGDAIREGVMRMKALMKAGEPKDRILAFRELVRTAKELPGMDIGEGAAIPLGKFDDDLVVQSEDTEWPTVPSLTPSEGDLTSKEPLPQEPPSLSQ